MDQTPYAKSRVPVNIEDEMKRSYMDYAMSVIIGRALPDVRDGLKPAHRRVLYGMKMMGLASNRAYRKCAKIVGEVMGNYHPHGDSSIYDTLVRMAQDFNMRYPLVDGQGNFGSVDGDPPAAMRYTEARLEALAEDLMADLDKETVDFVPNYDETTEEPSVLPAPFPNLLVNGSTGIAVGMATNIPPHNLGEVIDALIWLIDNSTSSRDTEDEEPGPTREEKLRKVFELIPGPDFPTGGFIVGRSGIQQAYLTGRGSITLRARTMFEDNKKGDRTSIVVTEIPYQVNKAKLLEKIADLAREKVVEGISDLRDESDREGMRIVVELKRGEVPEVILNNLYKHTQLQTTFGVITLAIVGGRPRVLPLVDLLELFIEFRRDVVRRRTEFELRKAEARAHILEGLKIALDHLDAVIALIRASRNPADARTGLMTEFGLSELQSQAILDMQLQRLTGLERQKILDELAELMKTIERLRAILASERLLMQIVVDELRAVQDRYRDPRRTEIIGEVGEISTLDLIADEDVAITVTNTGYIKRTTLDEYRKQARGGKGLKGMTVREEDAVSHLFVASTHSYILIFARSGKLYWLRAHEIPDVSRDAKGTAIVNLVEMGADKLAAVVAVRSFPDEEGQPVRRDGDQTRRHQEDRPARLLEPPDRRDHRHGRRGGRPGHRRAVVGRLERGVPRDAGRAGHPVPGKRRPGHGPHRLRGARHLPEGRRRGRRHGRHPVGRHDADRHRKRLRQAHGHRRIPGAVPGRTGYHQHPNVGAERQSRRDRPRLGRRPVDAGDGTGQNPPDVGGWDPGDRPQRAGRAADADRVRRGRSGGIRRPIRGETGGSV